MKKVKSSISQTALIPDLLAIPATDFQIQEITVRGRKRRLLRFSQAFGNIGSGPVQIRWVKSNRRCRGRNKALGFQEIMYSDGSQKSIPLKKCIIFHPKHKHWHVANIARHDLLTVNESTGGAGTRVSTSDKISFCLIDEYRIDSSLYDGPEYPQKYTSCKEQVSGISPGWVDEYSYDVYGQWVDITRVKDGDYFLRTVINPRNLLIEKTKTNNKAFTKIRISDNGENVSVLD